MATLRAATTANRPAIDPERVDELNRLISEYDFSGSHESLTVTARDPGPKEERPILELHGYAVFQPQRIKNTYVNREPDLEDDSIDEFLERVAPFLEEKLVIQTIGREKARFPFLATMYAVWPDGTVTQERLSNDPEKPLTTSTEDGSGRSSSASES